MTTTRTRRPALSALAAALLAGAALAGCGEDPSDVAAPAGGEAGGEATSIPPTSRPSVAPAAPQAGEDGETGEREADDAVQGEAQGGESQDGEVANPSGGQTPGAAGAQGGVSEQDDDGEGDAIGTGQIRIRDFQFEPQVVTVEAGTTLGWINEDEAPHRIVAEDGAFTSEDLAQGDQFTTFAPDGEGEYPYVCGIHPQMRGTIVVE